MFFDVYKLRECQYRFFADMPILVIADMPTFPKIRNSPLLQLDRIPFYALNFFQKLIIFPDIEELNKDKNET